MYGRNHPAVPSCCLSSWLEVSWQGYGRLAGGLSRGLPVLRPESQPVQTSSKLTSKQLPEATSTGRALHVKLTSNSPRYIEPGLSLGIKRVWCDERSCRLPIKADSVLMTG